MRSQLAQRFAQLGLAVVRGRSMLPTLREGDRLLVTYAAAPSVGRLVVVRLPDGPDGVVAVKRVTADNGTDLIVESDNVAEGWAGTVSKDSVRAVVIARVWPRPGTLRVG